MAKYFADSSLFDWSNAARQAEPHYRRGERDRFGKNRKAEIQPIRLNAESARRWFGGYHGHIIQCF